MILKMLSEKISTHLIIKVGLWKERDKAIELRLESLNNKTLEKVSADKDAKFNAKSKDKIWHGYKQHISVDMQSGMINKVAITPANIIDSKGLKHVAQVRERFMLIRVTAIKMPNKQRKSKTFILLRSKKTT